MADPLTSEFFAPHVGQQFEAVPTEGEPFEAVLTSCDETTYGDRDQWLQSIDRVPFSLVFHAPGGELLPQQTFTLRHPELGELAIFLVPLG
ncbi:MAG: hypothetical protein QOG63_2902, partial [Thermoleophilaceae bacterium]|nr:hypothetical protein [Thermoleophilaceae bacterium]